MVASLRLPPDMFHLLKQSQHPALQETSLTSNTSVNISVKFEIIPTLFGLFGVRLILQSCLIHENQRHD